jgi:hypothetical protein
MHCISSPLSLSPQVLDTLFDVAGSRLPLAELVRHLHEGLCDEEKDIQLLTYHMLHKIAVRRQR